MIERLRDVLASSGIALTPAELADVLWLALRLPTEGLTAAQNPVPHALQEGGGPADIPTPRSQEQHGFAADSDLFSYGGDGVPGTAGDLMRLPAERTLPGSLAIGSALRSLKRSTPDHSAKEIDDTSTVDLIAETGILDVVLQPMKGQWLDVSLVVDDGLSMKLWQETARELRILMEQTGVFRRVRAFGLDTRTPDAPVLRTAPFRPSGARVAPQSLCPADRRAVVLILSDVIGPGWHTSATQSLLSFCAERCPTAIVQPLPRRLWAGTRLNIELKTVSGPRAGSANKALRVDDPWLPPELGQFTGVPVPVVELHPSALAQWAKLVADGSSTPLHVIPVSSDRQNSPTSSSVSAPADLREHLAFFRRAASPEAFRLAGHLAAVRPLTLGLMRLVQRSVFGRSDPAPLAEVLLGGLMRQSPDPARPNVTHYDYRPGMRDLLMETVPSGDLLKTAQLVTDGLRLSQPAPRTFSAIRSDLSGSLRLPPGASAFALAAVPLLQHFGLTKRGPGSEGDLMEGNGQQLISEGPLESLTSRDEELQALVAARAWRAAVSRAEIVLEQLTARHGERSLPVFAGRRDLAEWIGLAGAPQSALRLLRQLRAELEDLLGPHDLRVLSIAVSAAHWAGTSGQPRDAAEQLTAILAAQEQALGPDDLECLSTRRRMSYWTGVIGKPEAALHLHLDLLRREERLLPHNDLITLNTRANVVSWTGRNGRPEEARELCAQLVQDVENTAPIDHPLRSITASELAHWTAEAGDPSTVVTQLTHLLPKLYEVMGVAHSYPYATRQRIAHWTGVLSDPQAALEQMRTLLVDIAAVLTAEHPVFLSSRVEYAHWTARTGYTAEARQLLENLLPEVSEILGPQAPEAVRARNLLDSLGDQVE
ncbi:SAV_2336 N-terminal domain-related protein [Streptomyces sp. SLBN-8D4]|jgi:hypothetical protein|uniref:SAV_2336 N-terminal domain-related protein n=1 Tax=Streptomyces sp. SLBN-8D4 TaxID=3377728 RepID=UPI003C7E3F79